MKRMAAVSVWLLAWALPYLAFAQGGGGISISVTAQFVKESKVQSAWEAEYLDAQGNPAGIDDWVALTLRAQMTNASSQPVTVSWRLPKEIQGVTALSPDAMGSAYVAVNQSLEFTLLFSRDPNIPLPEGGLQLEYVVDASPPVQAGKEQDP